MRASTSVSLALSDSQSLSSLYSGVHHKFKRDLGQPVRDSIEDSKGEKTEIYISALD
ncbi:unnamed protein product, partial [Ilex paraguariensis]